MNEKYILNHILCFYMEFNSLEKYLSYSDIKNIKEKYSSLYKMIVNSFLSSVKYIRFIYDYKHIETLKKYQNEKFINYKLKNTKKLLDNINGHSLDYNQRLAVLSSEDNTLVIAGAGSGKTLTIIAKIRYLIENMKINQDEILCISFTNDSVNDIKNALSENYNYDIDVYTFHKLALNILNESNENKFTIANDYLLNYVVDEYIRSNFNDNIILLDSNTKFYMRFKILISTFINLFKSNNYDVSKFDEFFITNYKEKDKNVRWKNFILLRLIKEIYSVYMEELKSQNMIDFNDMINLSLKKIKDKIKYKYIIIDEYQDTSLTRYMLIKKIKDISGAKIIAVGDDFQSIYRFTGCNLSMFLNFEKYFGKSKILKIENTYRNSKELISVAGKFIMKNKYQMKKNLKSNITLNKPIKIVYYNDLIIAFENIINNIDTDIFVLGRNNKDITPILKSQNFTINENNIIYSKDKSKNIKFLTVHRSKGLEASNTIILNMVDDYLGFPNKVINDNIFNFVIKDSDIYPYEEERRLFYVALTRTKNNVYLFTKKNNESIFIKEIINNSRKNIQILNELI